MKKLLLLIFLYIFSIGVIHAEITWTLSNDGTLTISGTDMPDYDFSGSNFAPWYFQKDKIKKIVIEKGVTSIGDYAFFGCSGLTSVTIGNSVMSIGKSAFSGCSGLTSITIPNSVTSIGNNAFDGCCSGLTSITVEKENSNYNSRNNCNAIIETKSNTLIIGCKNTIIPNSVTSIGNSAFRDCSGLSSLTIPNSVTSIGDYAFYNCSCLTSLTIPNSVMSIGKDAFWQCSGLTSVIIGNSVTSIGNGAFWACSALKKVFNSSSLSMKRGLSNNGYIAYYANVVYNNVSIEGNFRICKDGKGNSCVCDYFGTDNSITLPKNIYGIADYAFSACCDLISVTIPNNVKSIGNYAFSGCHLQTLTIGTDVTSIGSDAFGYNNSKPYKVIWLPNTPPSGYANVAGNINYVSNENYSKIQNTKVYKHLSSMFEVDGIKYVPVSPSERTCDAIDCNYDKAIENINISDVVSYKNIGMTVLNINSYTFYGNEFIKTLYINNSGKIDERAFEGCNNITSVTFGNKVSNIGNYAFSGCKNITSVTLGNNVTGIGDYAFYGCIAIKDIKIPDCVTSVGKYGFGGCSALQSLVIGKGLTSVGDYCFSGCRLLNKVVFGDCPTTIGANAFKDCSSLTELNLGKKVTTIGNYTFANCSSLAKISIPKATTSIGNYAFSGCKALADVTIEDRTEKISLGSNGSSPLFADSPISSVYLGGKLSYNTSSNSGYSPFYRNKSLQSVVITDTEEQIYDNEFYGCTNLKSVKIGDGVKSIGNWAFSGCANLESFSFGKSMQSIGKEAFSDCTKMTSITSYAAKAPECGSQALDDIDKWSCVLSVPYSCLASYQNADQWKEFFFIQEAEVDEKLVAAKAAFDKYKSEQKTIIEALAKEDDSDAVKAIINKAISDINAMGYDVKISLDENKAKILSFINLIDDAVEKQRAEDQKTNGIEELEFADKYNIYDLNGRKITNSVFKSGLYIRNGKKVVVK